MPAKHRPKHAAPKRYPWSGGSSPRPDFEEPVEPLPRYDENGFLFESISEPPVNGFERLSPAELPGFEGPGPSFEATPDMATGRSQRLSSTELPGLEAPSFEATPDTATGRSGGRHDEMVPHSGPTPELALPTPADAVDAGAEPAARVPGTSGVWSSLDHMQVGRKLGSSRGEDFWADPPVAKKSRADAPRRGDPFGAGSLDEAFTGRSKRRDRTDPGDRPVQPDPPEAPLPSIDLLERSAPKRPSFAQRINGNVEPEVVPAPRRSSQEPARPVPPGRARRDESDPTRQLPASAKWEVDPQTSGRMPATRGWDEDLGQPDGAPAHKMSRRERKQLDALEKQQQQSLGQWFKEIFLLGVVAVGTAVLLTTYLLQAFFIPSGSMENTLLVNDRVLVNKAAYRFSEPKMGDVIVFISPEGILAPSPADTPYARFMDKLAIGIGLKSREQDLIKRVIATGGQTIEFKVGQVFVDGQQLREPYLKSREDILADMSPQIVPEGQLFVLGDNRRDSKDSQEFGPVSESKIIGKAFARIWPFERIQLLSG
ncbi:MAG: signal peptidase I [Actinomycetota bacterium]